jgi:hypothetical protein
MTVATSIGLLILLTWVNVHAQGSNLPAQQFGYVMAQGSSTILVIDTSHHDRWSPPRMKMWYNSGCAAGPEVV